MPFNKKRMILFTLLLVIFGIGAFTFYLFSTGSLFGSKSADRLIADADKNEDKAIRIINRMVEIMETNVTADPQGAKRKFEEAGNEISEARDQLESAGASLQDIDDLRVQTWEKNYADLRIQSISNRIKAVDSLKRWFSKMELIADFLHRTTSARQKFNYGIEKINESINYTNNKEYDKAKTEASKGKQLFDESQGLLQEAAKMQKGSGLDPVLTIVSKAQDLASLTIQLAEAGATGNVTEYNDIANRYASMKPEVLKEWEPDVIKEPRKWYAKKTKSLEDSIKDYMLKAEELKDSADELHEKNTK